MYVQHNGVAMGAPLAPVIADIFMTYLETTLMDKLTQLGVCEWYRYEKYCIKDVLIAQQKYNKQRYDKHRPNPHYHIGDRVFTKIFTTRGKLDPHYSSEPNIITEIHHPTDSVLNEYTGIVKQFHVSDIRPIIPVYEPDPNN
ncbi:unnamed protein product [Rotaria sordida]|uniref:Uncharacterized protein n=2 Tax=Rotaria sordida TaxID=392033 RepID=A0A815QY63_9BILA|nr:unnamed protein product [Rotaria sordida]